MDSYSQFGHFQSGQFLKLNGERHHQVVIFVAIVGDGHRQLPQMSLLGGDVHHLIFTVYIFMHYTIIVN